LEWIPKVDPYGFACAGCAVGATVGGSLVSGSLRWRIALAAVGGMAGSLGPLNACDGSVFIVPIFSAFVGGVLGFWIGTIRRAAPSRRRIGAGCWKRNGRVGRPSSCRR